MTISKAPGAWVLLVLALLFGALFLVFAYCAGWLDFMLDDPEEEEAQPRPRPSSKAFADLSRPMRVAGAPGGPPILRASEAEIEQQNKKCADVRKKSLKAAKAVRDYAESLSPKPTDLDSLADAVSELRDIVDELGQLGPLGVSVTTQLCNALIETDTLKALDALQTHSDANVAKHSRKVFEHVVPHIWSF